jgi:S-ribosylhomocysteine lyase
MKKVESFELDHDEVRAPYVRRAGSIHTGGKSCGCEITKFDLRFTQPNVSFLPVEAMHTLEHLLATNLRKYTNDLVDISPMGCRTGFYSVFVGDKGPCEVAEYLVKSLEDVLEADEIPGAGKKSCGNYLSHDLDGAKEVARKFLDADKTRLTDVYGEK